MAAHSPRADDAHTAATHAYGRLVRAPGASAVPVRLGEPKHVSGRRAAWLGFNSVTEIDLLAIAATQASQGLPLFGILLFPKLFMAGMTLIDATKC